MYNITVRASRTVRLSRANGAGGGGGDGDGDGDDVESVQESWILLRALEAYEG